MAPSAKSGDGRDASGLGGRLRRRAGEVRAALLLEEAGEVEEAARVFEQVGAFAQAAALRLEHARTQRDPDARLRILREACARARGDAPQVRALFRALAEASLEAARTATGARRRDWVLEAARALERAGDGEAAGRLFERLGRHADAARCFEAAGDIEGMEHALLAADRQAEPGRRARALLADVRERIAAGDRAGARARLEGAPTAGWPADLRAAAARTLEHLRERWTGPPGLRIRTGEATLRLVVARSVVLGRGTDAAVLVADPSVSRHHARLVLSGDGPATLEDLDSRSGTFLDGAPLVPGRPTPVAPPARLALGLAAPMEVATAGPGPGALRIEAPDATVLVAAPGAPVEILGPGSEPLAATAPPDGPVTLRTAGPEPAVRVAGGPWVRSVDVLVGDRIEVRGAPGRSLEVLP